MATIYDIRTKTGGEDSNGTDAKIFITLHGENNIDSDEIELDTPGKDDFMRGAIDTFRISVPQDNFGPIRAITMRNDNSGPQPGWWLVWVKVSNDGHTGEFPLDNWIAEDEENGLTVVINRNGAWA